MRSSIAVTLLLAVAAPLSAQSFATDNPVLRRIWELGMEQSRAGELAQILMDSVGPRLTGAPGQLAAHDWAVKAYASFGVQAENEQYGTWTGWRRGTHHVDLIAPRVKTLWAEVPAWSGGTNGTVEGEVLMLPQVSSMAQFEAWLPSARGNFVLTQTALISCRHERQYEEYGTAGALERLEAEQDALDEAFDAQRVDPTGLNMNNLRSRLADAGVAGLLQSSWRYDGTLGILSTQIRNAPTIDLTCEDYGLLYRLADNGQGPRLRANVDVEFTGTAPTFNTIATIPGGERADEYIMLSSHFDSWDAGSGATDNGTGTIVMMEAMRIIAEAYPNPRRTIISGHWSGEEQGLNGSEAWREDHPEVVERMQALFNQDNGTGRVVRISTQGLMRAGEYFARWLAQIPSEITGNIQLQVPGTPGRGGTDSSSFICAGAPAFGLSSLSWDYNPYTHHTNLDTYDKIVLEEVRNNATLTAMLIYLASEEPNFMERERRPIGPAGRGGRGGRGGGGAAAPTGPQPLQWPDCSMPQRSDPRGGG